MSANGVTCCARPMLLISLGSVTGLTVRLCRSCSRRQWFHHAASINAVDAIEVVRIASERHRYDNAGQVIYLDRSRARAWTR
jgi:hypothetical protein